MPSYICYFHDKGCVICLEMLRFSVLCFRKKSKQNYIPLPKHFGKLSKIIKVIEVWKICSTWLDFNNAWKLHFHKPNSDRWSSSTKFRCFIMSLKKCANFWIKHHKEHKVQCAISYRHAWKEHWKKNIDNRIIVNVLHFYSQLWKFNCDVVK